MPPPSMSKSKLSNEQVKATDRALIDVSEKHIAFIFRVE
jgi:hypothetical protein